MSYDIRLGNVSKECCLGDYYLDFSGTVAPVAAGLYGPLDDKGIPLIDYDRMFKSSWMFGGKRRKYGVHYTPVTISQYALGLYGQLLNGKGDECKKSFLIQARWLRDNLVRMPDGFGLWLHWFSQRSYSLEPPWVSAMAQGQGISALLRAFDLTGDNRYLEAAQLAFQAFRHDVKAGGVAFQDGNGCLWFEEYPSRPASHVLNGFIFALWGIFDLWRVTADESIFKFWQQGLDTLKVNLPRYEWGTDWSRYDLIREEKASYEYHLTHVMQLEVLAQLTGEPLFREYGERWRRGAENVNLTALSAARYARGALRRIGLLKRPAVKGITVDCTNCG